MIILTIPLILFPQLSILYGFVSLFKEEFRKFFFISLSAFICPIAPLIVYLKDYPILLPLILIIWAFFVKFSLFKISLFLITVVPYYLAKGKEEHILAGVLLSYLFSIENIIDLIVFSIIGVIMNSALKNPPSDSVIYISILYLLKNPLILVGCFGAIIISKILKIKEIPYEIILSMPSELGFMMYIFYIFKNLKFDESTYMYFIFSYFVNFPISILTFLINVYSKLTSEKYILLLFLLLIIL
jgi:hypothetical protein